MGLPIDRERDEVVRLWKQAGVATCVWAGLVAGLIGLANAGHVGAAEVTCLPLVPATVWLALGSVAAGFQSICWLRHARRDGALRSAPYALLLCAAIGVPLALIVACVGALLMLLGFSAW